MSVVEPVHGSAGIVQKRGRSVEGRSGGRGGDSVELLDGSEVGGSGVETLLLGVGPSARESILGAQCGGGLDARRGDGLTLVHVEKRGDSVVLGTTRGGVRFGTPAEHPRPATCHLFDSTDGNPGDVVLVGGVRPRTGHSHYG